MRRNSTELRLSLDRNNPIVAAWLDYIASAMPGASPSQAALEALEGHMSGDPMDPHRLALKHAAWQRMVRLARGYTAIALSQARTAFDDDPSE